MDKKDVYYAASIISNFILVLSIIFLSISFIAPLFGGQLFFIAIIKYSSWLALALALKIVLKRLQKEMRIGKKEYLLIYFVTVMNLLFWIIFPFNIVLIVLAAITLIYSYNKRMGAKEDKEI